MRAQCCPLYGDDDGEGARVMLTRIRTARRPHRCSECDEEVPSGQKYEITTGCWDGSWSTYKTCMSCREIRDHFACGSWTYTMVWEQIESGFFPGMVAGGPCMDGLSPAAKARLFERRLAWLEADPEHAKREIRSYRAAQENHNIGRWHKFLTMWGHIGSAVANKGRDLQDRRPERL